MKWSEREAMLNGRIYLVSHPLGVTHQVNPVRTLMFPQLVINRVGIAKRLSEFLYIIGGVQSE